MSLREELIALMVARGVERIWLDPQCSEQELRAMIALERKPPEKHWQEIEEKRRRGEEVEWKDQPRFHRKPIGACRT